MRIIKIGAQQGGPEDCAFPVLKVDLTKELEKTCTSTFCDAIDEYSLVLRIDGSIRQFGDEGITRLRFAKKSRYITADIQIPESVWKACDTNELKEYLALKVRECIVVFVERLKRDKLEVDESALFYELDTALSQFTSVNYDTEDG